MRYTEFKLLEYDRSKTEQALSNSIVKAAQRDSYLKSQNLDDAQTADLVINHAEELDPTQNLQYVTWIIRQFTKKGMKFEDLYKLRSHLETFENTKGQHKRLKINSDINQYDWRTLTDTARRLSNTDIADPETADATQVEGARILYNGPLGTLSIPETEAASCELGRGTEWCTAATKSDNKFDDYNKQGPLYIWHDKKKKTKYQFHFESGQIMDAQDQPVSDSEARYLAKENPITSKLIEKNASKTIDAYVDYLNYHAEPPEDDVWGHDEPDMEIIDANLEILFSALGNKEFASLYIPAVTDSNDDVDLNKFKKAWFKELSQRPQIHEKLAAVRPNSIPMQYALITGKRSAAMEKSLLSAEYNTRALLNYAERVIQGAWPEAEPQLSKSSVDAFFYAVHVLKDRFPEAEPLIKQNELAWKQYKRDLGLENEI